MSSKPKTFTERLKQPTSWMILAFILLVVYGLLWGPQARAEGVDVRATIGLGYGSTHQSTLIVSELGVELDEKWVVRVAKVGRDPRVPDSLVVTGARRIPLRDGRYFDPYVSIGVSWYEHKPFGLVNDHTPYDLALGVRICDTFDLEWHHNSTAGRSSPNRGVDYVILRASMEF